MSSILDEIAGVDQSSDAYDKLPESIKGMYTRREWLWFSDAEKVNLVKNECMPEIFED